LSKINFLIYQNVIPIVDIDLIHISEVIFVLVQVSYILYIYIYIYIIYFITKFSYIINS